MVTNSVIQRKESRRTPSSIVISAIATKANPNMEPNEEELEFGMNRPGSFESDPMEIDRPTEVKDHPDFTFLEESELRAIAEERTGDSGSASPSSPERMAWLASLPIERDATQWTFLQVQVRPDRAWSVIKELVGTVCIGHGMMVAEESHSAVLFRKKVGQDSMAHGMMDTATYQNMYVRIGVLPSKLRALHIGYIVTHDQKLLGGAVSPYLPGLGADRLKALKRSMDKLLAALQSTLVSQYLPASYLYMTTPENTAKPAAGDDAIELDPGYVSDVRKMFLREMKETMRDLCIPLEEYAHTQEYSCALLLGVLDPLLKKYNLDASTLYDKRDAAQAEREGEGLPLKALSEMEIGQNEGAQVGSAAAVDSTEKAAVEATGEKMYGEVITDMVRALWLSLKQECDQKVKRKMAEKRKQVTARITAVQKLRVQAVEAIMNHNGATLTSLKPTTPGDRNDVLLYEGSCIINNVPMKLNVTYGSIIFRTMVPLFATTTVVPFQDVQEVVQASTLGIRVVNVLLNANHPRGLTIAMGTEVDLLHQLLLEIFEMRKHNAIDLGAIEPAFTEPSSLFGEASPLDAREAATLLGEEEEEKEEDRDEDTSVSKRSKHVPEEPSALS